MLILACIYGVLDHGSTGASIEALLLGCTFFLFGNGFWIVFCSRGKRLLGGARIEFGSVSDVSIYTLFDSSSPVVFAIHLFNR